MKPTRWALREIAPVDGWRAYEYRPRYDPRAWPLLLSRAVQRIRYRVDKG